MKRVLGALALAASWAGSAEAARVALIVGNNDAIGEDVELRYAEQDALAVRDVLAELGGVSQTYSVLNRGPEALRQAFADIERDVARAEGPVTLFFYYSGHADDTALLMREGRFALSELRERLSHLPIDLFVAIVDACQSGALVRKKGGQAVPLVDLDLYQEGNEQRGGVFITAGTAGEAAQESDDIGASYFTHALISALRGAADDSQDGRISLEEAYRFAYAQTLDRTRATLHGPQHPSWEVNIRGQGQLVITWLDGQKSSLVLDEESSGQWLFRDLVADRLAVALSKASGRRMRVALEPGPYDVVHVGPNGAEHQEIRLDRGLEVLIDRSRMQKTQLAPKRVKGSPSPFSVGALLSARSGYFQGSDGAFGGGALFAFAVWPELELEARVGFSRSAFVRSDQLSVETSELSGAIGAAYRLFALDSMQLWASVGIDARVAFESARAVGGASQGLAAAVLGPEGRVSARFPLSRVLSLELSAGGAARFFRGDSGIRVKGDAFGEGGMRVAF